MKVHRLPKIGANNLPLPNAGDDRPTIFLLHYLGGSAREWAQVIERLVPLRCVSIDLPGFGDAAETPGYSVADMAAFVARAVRAEAPARWLLVGHSMGAKVAAALSRDAEDGARGLEGLTGLVLLAGSPPSPEPMDEEQRQSMMSWFSHDPQTNLADAEGYVANNSAADLTAAATTVAVADALRANRSAWIAWLARGSNEDWSDRVGVLQTPALIVAGEEDENLGPSAQEKLMAPHFAHVRAVQLPGAKHLLPLERPHEVARLIQEHVDSINGDRERSNDLSRAYRALIASDRVSSATREALLARDEPDDPGYEPVALSNDALITLRAMLDRVIPQSPSARIDLAARIDTQLGAGTGDGWRFAVLPPDAAAYGAGLLTLSEESRSQHGRNFSELAGFLQDDLLTCVADGSLGAMHEGAGPADRLNALQMRAWFEDLRADAVKAYMGHPETLARLGYSGIAYGGDGEPKSGFIRVGLGEREVWEPQAAGDTAR